jgi:hypothetical protein
MPNASPTKINSLNNIAEEKLNETSASKGSKKSQTVENAARRNVDIEFK